MVTCLRLAMFSAVVLSAGCGGAAKSYRTAQVSGRVTLDGKPLAAARVTFYPIHDRQSGIQSGPESYGDTDSDGRYSLSTVFDDAGAMIGPHRVTISTMKTQRDPTNPDNATVVVKERIPNKYFTEKALLKFDVPAAGTDAANFALDSK